MIMIKEVPEYPTEWKWWFAIIPTMVGYDESGNEIRIWLKWYEWRYNDMIWVERKFGSYEEYRTLQSGVE